MDSGTLVIRCGDQVIRKVKKRKLLPSVMEEAVLLRKDMTDLKDDLTIEIVEG